MSPLLPSPPTRKASVGNAFMSSMYSPAMPKPGPGNGVVMEGWVLKKRRKKMQGFARRYFTLYPSGLLSYSLERGQPARDQILLPQAAISTAPGRKDIHIDSTKATFHIKCLSMEDFTLWMAVFRKFIASDSATIGRKSSISRSMSTPRPGQYNRAGALVEEIGTTMMELQSAFSALVEEDKRRQANIARKPDKEKASTHGSSHGGAVRSLFKTRKSATHIHGSSNSGSSEDSFSGDHHKSISGDNSLQRMQTALETLKYQHSALSQALLPFIHKDVGPSVRGSPLLPVAKEAAEIATPSSGFSTIGRSTRRFSTQSESSVWFDAEEFDGAEEFVLDEVPDESQASKISDVGNVETPSSTTSEISGEDLESRSSESSNSESELCEDTPNLATSSTDNSPPSEAVVRRTQLPSPPVGDEGSLFAVLKKNVGKDLGSVALPVSFNEPLTLLQRLAEELEYYALLSNAVQATDEADRMCYVAAFAVSAYASTKYRSGRKGFNPMLAETFEDARLHLIAEKVCHNPVVLAYHAEGEGWRLWATSSGKTKFWGKSLEIIPHGTTHLVIGEDHYEWTRPSSFMRNLMMGTKYLEHSGKMVIQNKTTGGRCVLDFKESGYWGVPNQVAGTVISSNGRTIAHLEGKWDEQITQKLDTSHLKVLWRMTPFPRNAPEYYGFTSFGVTLNEITPDIEGKLPPTDSRLRPDVRALEEGDLNLAETEKVRVEEMQRERRRQGEERTPRWFKQVGEEWEYVGGYWEQRAQGWKDIDRLW